MKKKKKGKIKEKQKEKNQQKMCISGSQLRISYVAVSFL
jgi:hypothetical protein